MKQFAALSFIGAFALATSAFAQDARPNLVIVPDTWSMASGPLTERGTPEIASVEVRHGRTGVLQSPYERGNITLAEGTPVYAAGAFGDQFGGAPSGVTWCAPFARGRTTRALCVVPREGGDAARILADVGVNPYFVTRLPVQYSYGPLLDVREEPVDFGVTQRLSAHLWLVYHGFMGSSRAERLQLMIRITAGEDYSIVDMPWIYLDETGSATFPFGGRNLRLTVEPDQRTVRVEEQ